MARGIALKNVSADVRFHRYLARRMGRSYEGVCNICGNWDLLTDDHLPQKGLYPKKFRSSIIRMHSVKACSVCNNGSNEEDEILKVILGNIAHSYWEGEMWKSAVATLDKNRKLDRLIESHSELENIENKNGEVEATRVLTLKSELKDGFLAAIERIAKGLFYKEYNEVLVLKRNISTFHPVGLHPDKTEEIARNVLNSFEKEVNNGTCRYMFIEMDTTDIVLIMELYSSVKLHYVIQTNKT